MKKLLILLTAFAFVVAFTAPAIAEISFKGQARVDSYMLTQDEDAGDDSDLNWKLGLSYFGANFTAGDITGKVEMSSGVAMRHWYGQWKFGAGSLIVGQTTCPTFNPIDNSVIAAGVGSHGGSGKQPMLGLKTGDLFVALRAPTTTAVLGAAHADFDVTMPAIEAKYSLKAGPAGIKLWLGYNAYDDVDGADDATSVSSSTVGANVDLSFGAVGVGLSVHSRQNGSQGGFKGQAAGYDAAADELKNATTTGFELAVSYSISDTMGFNIGYGNTNGDVDDESDTNTESAYYVTLPITMAKGFTITPVIAIEDHGVDTAGNEEGTETTYGARWNIKF